MKNLIYSLLLISLFSSCLSVCFNQPQPKGGVVLNIVPKELQGKWIGDEETVIITDKGLEEIKEFKDSLGNIKETTHTEYILSDFVILENDSNRSVILEKASSYYVCNLKTPSESTNVDWMVFIIDIQSNGDMKFYYPQEPPYFGKGHGLKIEKVERSGRHGAYTNRSLKKTDEITAVYYSGQFRIKDIQKVIKPNNLLYTYKKDGTIVKPKFN